MGFPALVEIHLDAVVPVTVPPRTHGRRTRASSRRREPENQYFTADRKPITKKEADRLSSASETADLA